MTTFSIESLLETSADLIKFLNRAAIDIDEFQHICHNVVGDFYDPEKTIRLTGGYVPGDEKMKIVSELKIEPYLCRTPMAITGCLMQPRGVVDARNNGAHVAHILEAIKIIQH